MRQITRQSTTPVRQSAPGRGPDPGNRSIVRHSDAHGAASSGFGSVSDRAPRTASRRRTRATGTCRHDAATTPESPRRRPPHPDPPAGRRVRADARGSNNAQQRWRRWEAWLGSWKPACRAPVLDASRPVAGYPPRPPITESSGSRAIVWIAARAAGGERAERSTRHEVTQWTSSLRRRATSLHQGRRPASQTNEAADILKEPIDNE